MLLNGAVEMKKTISVAKDYDPFPFGRYVSEGEFSGERFREEFIWPELEAGNEVVVDLDGVLGGLGSSFLEEAFGGLVRKHNVSFNELKKHLTLVCEEDADIVSRTWRYVEKAAK